MSEEASGRSSTNVVLIVIAVIVGVLLLVVLACAGLGFFAFRAANQVVGPAIQQAAELNEANTVAETFLRQLAGGQIDAAYRSTTPDFQAAQTPKQLQNLVDQHPSLAQHTSIEFVSDQNAGAGRISIHYTMVGKAGTEVTVKLVKDNGQWKIDGLAVP